MSACNCAIVCLSVYLCAFARHMCVYISLHDKCLLHIISSSYYIHSISSVHKNPGRLSRSNSVASVSREGYTEASSP